MPVKLMVNVQYQQSLSEYDQDAPQDAEDRFAAGASMIRGWRPGCQPQEDQAFAMIDGLTRGGTRWSVVFNSATGEIHFRVAGVEKFKVFDMDDLEYECGRTDLQLKLTDASGSKAPGFTPYDEAADREQILTNGASIPNADPQTWEAMAEYSRMAGCS